MRAAIVGAGIAGLPRAQLLRDQGLDVQLFDKARGPSEIADLQNGDP